MRLAQLPLIVAVIVALTAFSAFLWQGPHPYYPGEVHAAAFDNDGDGCTSTEEAGSDPKFGGGPRDDSNFWDFYDTPADSVENRDRVVNIGDIIRVLLRFDASDQNKTASPNRNDDPLTTPLNDPPAYHPAYDRGPTAGPGAVNLTAADGVINMADVTRAVAQFNHICLDLRTNDAPALDGIEKQIAELGRTLTVQVSATDPEKDAITFGASPMPLPRNTTFDPTAGLLTFKPDLDQVGSFQLTITATDIGGLTDSEQFTIQVPPAPGTTTLAGTVHTENSAPLEGVRLVLGTQEPPFVTCANASTDPLVTCTDQNGDFFFDSALSGLQRLLIDGSTASHSTCPAITADPCYAAVPELITLMDGVDNVLETPIFLLPLDVASGDIIDPALTSIVDSSMIVIDEQEFPPITLTVPPGRAKVDDAMGPLFSGLVSISPVLDPALSPMPLPDEIVPSLYFALQPFGVIYDPPVPISFPNVEEFPPNSFVEIHALIHDTGKMEKIGEAVVSADGTLIESVDGEVGGVVRNNSWHLIIPTPPDERTNPATNPEGEGADCEGGSEVCLKSGDLSVGHDQVSYRSMGVSRSLRLEYHSSTASPAPVISKLSTPGNFVPPPVTMSTRLEVGGVLQGPEIFYDVPGFCTTGSCPLGVLSRTFDASSFATGLYPSTLTTSCNFPIGQRLGRQNQNVLVLNQMNSPFGAGWDLVGLRRIHRTATGDLLMTDGDASPLIFTPGSRATAEIKLSGERDFYHFTADAGEVVSVRLNRLSNLADGSGTLDPVVELRDSRGFLLARDDDSGSAIPDGPGSNALISTFRLEATDTYTIVASGKGGTRGPYNLLLTTASDTQVIEGHINPPTPIDPAFVFAGDISAVPEPAVPDFEFQGTISSPAELDTFSFPADGGTVASILVNRSANNPDGSGTLDPIVELRDSQGFLLAQDDNTGTNVPPGPGGNALILNVTLPTTDTYTIGVRGATGTTGPYDVDVIFGNLTVQTETDTFTFAASAGTTANIAVDRVANNPDGSATLDPVVELRDSQGILIATDDDTGTNLPPGPGRNALIVQFSLPATDTYSVKVIGGSSTVGPYTLEITFGNLPASLDVEDSGLVTVEAAIESPPGDFSSVRFNADGTITRTLKNGTAINFDALSSEEWIQTSVRDRNGNTTAYNYTAGRLDTITDPVGLTTLFRYVNGLLDEIEDPAGRITSLQHDGLGNLTEVVDPDGAITTYGYDDHLLTSQTSPRGNVTPDPSDFITVYTYDASGRFVSSVLPDGSTRGVQNTHAVGLFDPVNAGTEADPRNVVPASTIGSQFTDGNAQTTSFQADSLGNLTLITDPLGRETDIKRDPNGLTTRIERPNGAVTRLTYDDRGNLTASTEDAISATTTFTYEPVFNQVEAITDPKGNTTNINFDSNGNPVEIIDALGTVTKLVYDDPARNPSPAAGLLTSVTGAFDMPRVESTTLFEYDTLGRLVETTDPLTHVTTLEYDPAGNVTQSCDALGQITRFDYDDANRLIKVSDATTASVVLACPLVADPDPPCPEQGVGEPGVTCYEYDESGNLTSVIDARGSQTKFVYDSMDRPAELIDPLHSAEAEDGTTANTCEDSIDNDGDGQTDLSDPDCARDIFEYDGSGNRRFATDRNGQQIEFQYDQVNRLRQKILPGSLVTSFDYDLIDDLISVVDPDSSLTMTYDDVGRLETASTAGSPSQPDVTISYTYDKNGNRSSMTDPTGTTSYSDDELNRLTSMTNPSGQTSTFVYDVLSRRTELALPNGVTTTYAYDDASQLLCMVNQLTGGSTRCTEPTPVCKDQLGLDPISCFAYGYDDVGNRTNLSQERSPISVTSSLTYAYDDLNRLNQATNSVPSLPDETFQLDAVANRLRRDGKTEDASYDAANRLGQDQQFCYQHDANGNQTQKQAKVGGACSGEVTSYTYDAEDQLMRIDLPGPMVAEYRYDGLGRRIEKSIEGSATRYIYDNEDILLEYDGANMLQARYTHGPGVDEPLIMERDLDKGGTFENGEGFFYHTDALGSITDVTTASGQIELAYVYDSFGRIAGAVCQTETFIGVDDSTAALGNPTSCLQTPYAYIGRELDAETNLYYFRARYYDAMLGRFLQEDPAPLALGETNRYPYANNSPVSLTDPLGLKAGKGQEVCHEIEIYELVFHLAFGGPFLWTVPIVHVVCEIIVELIEDPPEQCDGYWTPPGPGKGGKCVPRNAEDPASTAQCSDGGRKPNQP